MTRTAPLLLALLLAMACNQGESSSPAASGTSDTSASASTASDTNGTSATNTAATASSDTSASSTAAAGASGATGSGACSMITAAELGSITGMTFDAGQSAAEQADMSKCVFNATGGQKASVTIDLHQSDASGLYKIMPGMATITGNGIGEQAWWSPQVSNFVSLKGGHTLHIALNVPGAKQEWAEAIAKTITPKM